MFREFANLKIMLLRDTDDGLGPPWQFWKRRRHMVALLAFFGFFNVYALRVNLSVAIVAMTARRNETLTNGTTISVSLCTALQ
jgi:sugar phosphate permease